MIDKNDQTEPTSGESAILQAKAVKELRNELLRIYINDAFMGLGIFFVFVAISIIIHFVASIFGGPLGIFIRMVGWFISAIGAICSISLVIRNAYDFIKLLIISPPQETSRPEVAGEGRVE